MVLIVVMKDISLTNDDFDKDVDDDRNCENMFIFVNFIFFHYQVLA